ncbi:MAG: hypothetical protein ACLGHT_02805, partial [Acidimicrobiia bacterium]
MDPVAVQAVLALVALAALVVAAMLLRAHRHAERRLTALASRLDVGVLDSQRSLEAALTTLERLADASMLRVGDESLRADRLAEALARVPLGVVLCDERGD